MTSVLVVDDNTGLRKVVSLLLSLDGYQVAEASNGLEALDIMAHGTIDILILDLEMPEMDGPTALQEARRMGFQGRVLILSAHGAQAAARELKADDAISKPFEPDELLSRVRLLSLAIDYSRRNGVTC